MRLNQIGYYGKTSDFSKSVVFPEASERKETFNFSQSDGISSVASNAIRSLVLPSVNFGEAIPPQTAKEINSVLKKEYGIKSTLTNPVVAKYFLNAVEDFVKLNEKDMFKGLKLSEGKPVATTYYDIVANPYKNEFEIEFTQNPKEKHLRHKAHIDFVRGRTASDNPKYMFYMLLGRYLYFKQNSEKYMYNSTNNLISPNIFLRIGSNAGEDYSSYIANYIATRMCNVPTTKIMNNTYEVLEGPIVNLPQQNNLKAIKGIQHSFSSTKEAHDYLKKYKINAIFPTVEIANLAVGAIEDYININNNKKLFQGLHIIYDTTKEPWLGATQPLLKEGVISFNTATTDWKHADKYAQRSYDTNWHSSNNPKKTFYHELAHWLHYKNNPQNYINLHLMFEDMKKIPIDSTIKNSEMNGLRKNFAKVSNYGAIDPQEFVAEYITARMNGQTYPEHINRLFKMFYNGLEDSIDKNGKKTAKILNGKIPLKFPTAE